MSSAVADPQLAAALDALHAAIDRVQQVGVAPVDGRDAYVVVRELQAVGNRMAWVQAQVLTEIDLGKLHREDAHASAKVMVRHAARLSPQEAARRARLAKALRDLPAVSEALRSGTVGSCQAERIARTHANPRVRHRLARHDAELVRLAQERSYRKQFLPTFAHRASSGVLGIEAIAGFLRRGGGRQACSLLTV